VATRRRTTRKRTEPERAPRHAYAAPVLVLAAIILAAGTWAYATSFAGVLVLDDMRAIVRNPTIRTLWPLSIPLSPPPQATVSGRPLANLSFALNYAAAPSDVRDVFEPAAAGSPVGEPFLRNVWGYHLLNLVIHLACALVLFGTVRRTLLTKRLGARFNTAAPWLACAVALVWVVHPLQTAAVTYVVQRVESLMGLFYLLTLYCAIRASDAKEAHQTAWTTAAIVSCACGMATKEVMVTAPFTVALWDYVFGVRRDGQSRWVLRIGLAATWMILGALVFGEHRGPSLNLQPGMVWQYLTTQTAVLVHYVRLAFVPLPLAFLYDWPLAASLRDVAAQATLVTGLLALTAIAIVRRKPAGFVGAWFFLILAPSSSVLPIVTEVAAEHRMYLSLAAIVVTVVVGVFVIGQRLLEPVRSQGDQGLASYRLLRPVRTHTMEPRFTHRAATAGSAARGLAGPKRFALALAALLTVAVVAGLGIGTRARNRVYASEERLWHDTVTTRPDDARPRVAYGIALANAGRLVEAETQLQAGVTLAPTDPVARVRLGSILAQQNKFDAAIPHLEQALVLRPDDVDAHRFLGEIYAIRRQDGLAVEHYDRAQAALPADAMLAAHLASILADSRDPMVRNGPRALALAERAVSLTARHEPRILEILSVAQAGVGRFAEAARTVREALELARVRGDRALVSALEYRASAYDNAAGQNLGPRR
jgi:protein O-mannosyl-transferase